MEALFTIPAGYLHPEGGKVKDVGIVLGHGENSEDWNGQLLSEVAVTLAKAGEHQEQQPVPWRAASATALAVVAVGIGWPCVASDHWWFVDPS
jgi:hypothetical protein